MRIKATLINPQQIFSKGQIAAGLTPPLGIAYLASFLLAHDYPIQIIDALGEDPHEINPFKKGSFLRGLKISEIVIFTFPKSTPPLMTQYILYLFAKKLCQCYLP